MRKLIPTAMKIKSMSMMDRRGPASKNIMSTARKRSNGMGQKMGVMDKMKKVFIGREKRGT